ncbi:hypothetical protein AOLI_G00218000 [Acnodon oligacanthus]
MLCFPWCCFKQKNKVYPADDGEAVSTVIRTSKTNTMTPELHQVTATDAGEISRPTTETHIATVVSGEIPVETKKASKISVAANNDVPTATDSQRDLSGSR